MRIDHLVWYHPDLAYGRRYFAECLDCEPLYGGEHPGEGTANAVSALGTWTYLEILGRDVKQGEGGLDPEVKSLQGSGLYHWAVGGVDLPDITARAAKAGLEGGALAPGGRVKPDGKRLDWTCWGLRNHRFGSLIPFFIDWRDSEHPALSAPRGGSLESFEIHSPEAEQLRGIFWILGLDIPVKESTASRAVATIRSRNALTTLSSFSPLPRGCVI